MDILQRRTLQWLFIICLSVIAGAKAVWVVQQVLTTGSADFGDFFGELLSVLLALLIRLGTDNNKPEGGS